MSSSSTTVAIVGIGGIFPDAPDLERYWRLIRDAKTAVREVPIGRWHVPAKSVYDPEVGKPDHVYCTRGCFLESSPQVEGLDGLDQLFHLLITAGRQAFEDARTGELDRSRVGVIIGNLALPTEAASQLSRNWLGRTFEEKLAVHPSQPVSLSPLNRYVAGLPAGILARSLGLGGVTSTLDAACASSLYAIKLAMDELLSGRADAMLTGGVSRPDPLYTQMGFSQLRALSKRGVSAPLDASGDGLLVGEGAGIFVLKRTADALATGDRIYGIIRAVGLSNDVGGSLLAPTSEGQLRAMRSAYSKAGWKPQDVDLIECHATGTPVGDAVEVASLRELWQGVVSETNPCIIGSVKSNVGHLLTAAGAAALTKVLLAMQHATLPPTANFKAAQPGMHLNESPFRVLTAASPWHRRGEAVPRRAAVSAFGFGGINAHLLVEEWLPQSSVPGKAEASLPTPEPIAVVGMDASFGPWKGLQAVQERVLGASGQELSPVTPAHWWGAQQSSWFREQGLQNTPFNGYFIDQVSVDPHLFRIPPKEMEEMLPQQLLMLQTAAKALQDAGLDKSDNPATGVFIGIALDLNSTTFCLRWPMPQQARNWATQRGLNLSETELEDWTARLRDSVGPALNANRTMGALGSIVASRIAREFRVGGPSFTLSSEENSGIRALGTAVSLLQQGELDHAVVGAVDLAGDLRAAMGHHAVHPFSTSGQCRPFDPLADGSIIGEGASAVVLKRLSDAERDGNRIYAVIRGIGASTGDLSCSTDAAYHQALERAYLNAGVDPATISLLEAAADGNRQQDSNEVTRLNDFFATTAPGSCLLGSVKAMLGHTGAVSGLASFTRACLALYQEIIPGNGSIEADGTALTAGPLSLSSSPRYWLRNRAEGPRRAGVSTIGVDGSCSHVVLEGWDQQQPAFRLERSAPLGTLPELLFPLVANSQAELAAELDLLLQRCRATAADGLASLSSEYCCRITLQANQPLGMALIAAGTEQLEALIEQARVTLQNGGESGDLTPALRDRLFYRATPVMHGGKVALVFPGSGNHYPDMGRELFSRWPEILRQQDSENLKLKNQFQPELFWGATDVRQLNDNHRAVIFGQVATGTAYSDLIQRFGVKPSAVIGYSLGESAGLFSQRAWRDRDLMYDRMQQSTLFTRDLAGDCRAAHKVWGLGDHEQVHWSLGVVMAPADQVRQAMASLSRVYLLIINTPDECVIGGDASGVSELVNRLGCHFFPLYGVTTVHCEVAKTVAVPYHDLHLFPTTPPAGITFYSCAKEGSYELTSENAANSILNQALQGINYQATIEAAYRDGIRLFLEMGPGNSCSRMIGRILEGRPHLARSICSAGQEPVLTLLRLLGSLISERVPLDLTPLCIAPHARTMEAGNGPQVRLVSGGKPFNPPQPPAHSAADLKTTPISSTQSSSSQATPAASEQSISDALLQEFSNVQSAQIAAHEAFLNLSTTITQSMAQAIQLQTALQQTIGITVAPDSNRSPAPPGNGAAFNRAMCMEFATGSVARMLGPRFAEVDRFPTRVRLPDEPLMLVDRIISVEGEPCSMGSGRVVTEHDIVPNAWYLDGGRIPTCIAVEAGQADLFLSGYLGIDFITEGLAVYRLLDASVTFHRSLPGPGETIRYDIHIERFFRQGDTWLFRFNFEATVGGEPLLSMRDGCAGFFNAAALDAGQGIVRPAIDRRPTTGIRQPDWQDLLPLEKEAYSAQQLDCLRNGDLSGCFGPLFSGLSIKQPLTIPGGKMRLVHRVNEIVPDGGRYGLGVILAEADIHPDDWFITCHFVDDRVMPGTLMYECCMHTLRILLVRMGWVCEAGNAAWEPVPGVISKLCCRGQVLESTKVVTYEVTLREIGYRPEPYVVVDALMYADGKPIVEISSMSCRLSGTSKSDLEALWHTQHEKRYEEGQTALSSSFSKPAIYTKEQILAYSNGKPSEGFGELYQVFDSQRKIARLPGPPFQFMDRVTSVKGAPWQMKAGAMAEAQYDLPVDAWFFTAERQPRMPFCVLLEAALQPCGWLAAYVGSALTTPNDIAFRNLGGSAIQHRSITPASGTLTCSASLTKAVTSGGMIIQEFSFSVADQQGLLYEGETMFGFFSREALANQVGIRDASLYQPAESEISRGRSLPYPTAAPFPDTMLRMIDRIDLYVPDGGPAGLGYIRGTKQVDPEEWFFKAHFYQDPVTPGSLGLESFLQLLKFAVVEQWGWQEGVMLAAVAPEHRHRWLYRGQIVPTNHQVTVEAWITAVDSRERIMTASGFLAVDGKLIYQMTDFTVRMEHIR